MEPANHKIERSFLDTKTIEKVVDYVNSINELIILNDHHLKYLVSKLKGSSYMYDISKTDLTGKLTTFQSGGHIVSEDLPIVFTEIIKQISAKMHLSTDNVFLQIVDMNEGGTVGKHYDASFEGFINYKCNISIQSDDYDFCIDDQTVHIKQSDMYCFEASLYKHWTPKPFDSRRILLSFGFLIPYEELGRDIEDPRIRLSKRIQKYFQL